MNLIYIVMIKEVTKYYSDIDTDYLFSTAEEAEEFEKTYKPFYVLNDEVELCLDNIIGKPYPKHYPEPEELAKNIFDNAKELLDKWLDNEYNARIVGISTLERLRNIEYNKDDISYVSNLFEGTERWSIISKLFDNIYCIKMRY